MNDWIELVKVIGPFGAIAAFFIWRDYQTSKDQKTRETALGRRLDVIVDRHSNMAETVIVNNTKALESMSQSNKDLQREIQDACKYRHP